MTYKIDIGCGTNKKEGFLGIDIQNIPGVDYVADLTVDPLPFPDQSVEYVYSNHFLEHIADPSHIFSEIGRVCVDKANLEFWTPYAFGPGAFIFDHKFFFTEEPYMHMCVKYVDFWKPILHSQWLLNEIHYIINPDAMDDLMANKVDIGFAIKYFKGVVEEFGVFIEVQRNYTGPTRLPERYFSTGRGEKPKPIIPTKRVGPPIYNKLLSFLKKARD